MLNFKIIYNHLISQTEAFLLSGILFKKLRSYLKITRPNDHYRSVGRENYKIKNFQHLAFTLIEVAIAIFIIGILTSFVVIAVKDSRNKALDASKINSIKNIQTALDFYLARENVYPDSLPYGEPLVGPSGQTYDEKLPDQLQGKLSGSNCSSNNVFNYVPSGDRKSYNLIYCLNNTMATCSSGLSVASPNSVCQCQPSCEGLVGWWLLDGVNGAKDMSGNGNNATVNSAIVPGTGRYGEANGAFYYSGSQGFGWPVYISVSPSLKTSKAFTVSAWYKNSGGASYQPVIYGQQFYILPRLATSVSWAVWGTTGCTTYFGSSYGCAGGGLCPNVWTHYVLTYNSELATDSAVGYTNGVKVTSANCVGAPSQNNGSIVIGNAESGSVFVGSIADVRIYNRALSATEVSELYNTTKP